MRNVLLWLFLSIGIALGIGWITTIMFIIWDENHRELYGKALGTCIVFLVLWFIVFNIIDEELT